MSNNVLVNPDYLTAIANAIRTQNGENINYKPSEMAEAILNLSVEVESELPEGYTELQFILATGAQSINTGYSPSGTSRIVMDCLPTAFTYESQNYTTNNKKAFCFFCARTKVGIQTSDNNTLFWIDNTYRYDYYGASISADAASASVLTRTSIDCNQGDSTINDSSISHTTSSAKTTMPWILCASSYSNASSLEAGLDNFASMILFSCQIYDNGEQVRNFIPCLNPDSIVGLYDLINGVFYESMTDTAFVAGPKIKNS